MRLKYTAYKHVCCSLGKDIEELYILFCIKRTDVQRSFALSCITVCLYMLNKSLPSFFVPEWQWITIHQWQNSHEIFKIKCRRHFIPQAWQRSELQYHLFLFISIALHRFPFCFTQVACTVPDKGRHPADLIPVLLLASKSKSKQPWLAALNSTKSW